MHDNRRHEMVFVFQSTDLAQLIFFQAYLVSESNGRGPGSWRLEEGPQRHF